MTASRGLPAPCKRSLRRKTKRPPYDTVAGLRRSSSLLLIALLGLRDARIFGITGQGVALLFGDLVLRFHLVFRLVGFRPCFRLVRLGIGFGLGVVGLGLLHAHIL